MRKTISTILAITMLTTPLVSYTCFASEKPELNIAQQNNCEKFVNDEKKLPNGSKESNFSKPNDEQPKQSKILKTLSNLSISDTLKATAAWVKQSKAWKRRRALKRIAGSAVGAVVGAAVGTTVMMGATVAGLKICEDLLPEQVKEWLPSWLKKGNAQKQESNNFSDNTINEHTSEDATQYPAANQIDNINLGESEPVEPHESVRSASASMESPDHQNMLQPMCTEVPRILNTTTAENRSVNNARDSYLLNEKCELSDIETDEGIFSTIKSTIKKNKPYILAGAILFAIASIAFGVWHGEAAAVREDIRNFFHIH